MELCCLAGTREVVEAAREAGATRIYLMADAFEGDVRVEGAIPWLDEVCREPDHTRIDPLVREGEPCVVSNVSELALAQQRGAAFEVSFDLPVANEATVHLLEQSGARALWLSFELTESELAQVVASAKVPCGVTVAGALRAMTTEHCVLQQAGHCTRQCETCAIAGSRPVLENIDGRRLPVTTSHHRSRIWWDEPVDLTPHIDRLRELGITRFLVDARLMTPEEAATEVRRVAAALAGAKLERRPHTMVGHYLQPVD